LPVSKKDKNIIGAKLIFGRFGLPRRGGSSVPKSKENKATGAITDIQINLRMKRLSVFWKHH